MQISELLRGQPTRRPEFREDERLVDSDTLVGVEIEGEGRRIDTVRENLSGWWNLEPDGSLRNNGFEAILVQPLAGKSLMDALEDAEQALRGTSFSFRTSVHIHVDVANMDTDSLNRFLFYYTILEKDLFDWIGHERDQNPYCVPFYRQTRIIGSLRDAVNGQYHNLLEEEKYSAVNCASVRNLMSLEFRHMYGTRSMDTILKWINILLSIKKAAEEGVYDLSYNLLERVSNHGHEPFVRTILGSMADEVTSENTPINVMSGVRAAQDFVAITPEDRETLLGSFNLTNRQYQQAIGKLINKWGS